MKISSVRFFDVVLGASFTIFMLVVFLFLFTHGALSKLKLRVIIQISFSIRTERMYGSSTVHAIEHLQHSTLFLTLDAISPVVNIDTHLMTFFEF